MPDTPPTESLDAFLVRQLLASHARPRMYFREATLSCVASFIDGFQSAAAKLGVPLHVGRLPGFTEFVAQQLQLSSAAQGWHSLILYSCGGQQEQALVRFYELFEAYIQQSTPVA